MIVELIGVIIYKVQWQKVISNESVTNMNFVVLE